MELKITHKDLNGIDYLNGQANIDAKESVVYGGKALKGALAKYNGSFSQYKEMIFIKSMKRKLYEYQTERFEYKNLPSPMTKYRLERKLVNSGSALVIKIGEDYHVVNYTTEKFDMYEEPSIVRVVEPKSKLNGQRFNLMKAMNVCLVRNNDDMVALFTEQLRFITFMEKVLFLLEKNVVASAPKGILNLKNTELAFEEDGESPEKESMETIINGEDTFYVLRSKSMGEQNYGENEEDIFIPVELTDQTDKLLKNYFFAKEQLKESVGAEINSTSAKKERNVVDEVNEQAFSNANRQHSFNVRKIDIDEINKRFALNIEITYQSDDREEVEEVEEVKGGDDDEE